MNNLIEPKSKIKATKPMIIMLISLAVLFGLIIIYKIFSHMMIKKYMAKAANPIVSVSVMTVGKESWASEVKAVGSLRAQRGVDVTTEIAGLVKNIFFKPGSQAKEGEVLVELLQDADFARLQSLQAEEELALVVYKRDKAQYEVKAISQAVLDNDIANLKSKHAQVAEQAALLAKKTIRAPFNGRLGINYVNPGQYLNPGDKIVTLQDLDPIYADFYLPQQTIQVLKVGQKVLLTTDAFPNKKFVGKITTIDPKVDPATRNIQIEATIENKDYALYPGMFAEVQIDVGLPKEYITLPQTAVTYNPYGNIIYLVNENGKDKKGKPQLTVKQSFITTGEKRGDQVAVLEGLKVGDKVVTSGSHKLKNGTRVSINNQVLPSMDPKPQVINE